LSLSALALAGCSEHWYSFDDAELALEASPTAQVDARVTTPPGAWPDDLYGDALRVTLPGEEVHFVGSVEQGEVTEIAWEIDDHWQDNVNVLDAWRDCDRDTVCEQTFRFELRCADRDTCSGVVMADAFLSIEVGPQQAHRSGEMLDLRMTRVLSAATSSPSPLID